MPNAVRKSTPSDRSNSFLQQLEKVVEANLQNDQFGVEAFAEQMHMSRSNLHRKLKQTTGQTANQFVREYRLERAMELLKEEEKTITEVAYEVGFSSQSYFSTCFTEYYGYPPGEARFKARENASRTLQVASPGPRPPLSKIIGIAATLTIIAALSVFWFVNSQPVDSDEKEVASPFAERSVAVLPLKNLNVDQEYTYVSEGVVQAINRHLSQIEKLRVISPLSTNRYRETELSAQQIGKELQVANLLEGSIQRQAEKLRIEMRLVDTQTERQIWAESYDRQWQDILEIQGDIARQVAQALQVELPVTVASETSPNHSVHPEAYELFLKGSYEVRAYSKKSTLKAIEYYQQAIALDPDFAPPYAGMAHIYICMASVFSNEISPQQAFALAKPQLDKALALDPGLAEARTWNGFFTTFCQWDFTVAEVEFKEAIASDFPPALRLYSVFLQFMGRNEESLEMARRLHSTAPFFPHTQMIYSLYYNSMYEEAEEFAQTRLRMFNNYSTLESYGFLKLNTGQYEEAIDLFEQTINLAGLRNPRLLGWMGAAYTRMGQPEKAQALIQELEVKLTTNDAGSIRFFIAVIHAALGDKASALEWLQQACEAHEMEMPWLMSEPQFYPLHSEPEFQKLASNIGFPNLPASESSGLLTSTRQP